MDDREVKERRILEMLEQGIVSSDEAYRLLQAIDRVEEKQEEVAEAKKAEEGTEEATEGKTTQDSPYTHKEKWDDGWEGKVEQAFSVLEQGTKRLGRLMEYVVDQVRAIDWDAMFDLDWRERLKVKREWRGQWPEQGELEIDHQAGSVYLEGWSKDDYLILLDARVKEERQPVAEQIIESLWKYEREGNRHQIFMEADRRVRANLLIYLPQAQLDRLVVTTGNGKIHLEDLQLKQVELETKNGTVRGEDLTGDTCTIQTSNGSIRLEDAYFDSLQAKSSNGSIRIEGNFNSGALETSNGGILYEMERVKSGDIRLETKNGHIQLELPHGELDLEGVAKNRWGAIDITVPGLVIASEMRQGMQRELQLERKLEASERLRFQCSTMNGWIRIDED